MGWIDLFAMSTGWLLAVLLLSLRLGAMFLMTPVFSSSGVPVQVRLLFVLALSAALASGLGSIPGDGSQPPHARFEHLAAHPGALVEAASTEIALGMTLAVAIHLAFAVFAIAGRLLDIQIGFGLAQVFDPMFNATATVVSSAFNQIAVVVFFLVDGHHAILRAIAFSLERFPLGRGWPLEAAAVPIIKQMGSVLGLAFAITAPVVFCILLAELALGVLARNLPQMNMITMGIPIKIVIGLLALSVWASGMGPSMDRVYRSIYATWDATFATASAAQTSGGMR